MSHVPSEAPNSAIMARGEKARPVCISSRGDRVREPRIRATRQRLWSPFHNRAGLQPVQVRSGRSAQGTRSLGARDGLVRPAAQVEPPSLVSDSAGRMQWTSQGFLHECSVLLFFPAPWVLIAGT